MPSSIPYYIPLGPEVGLSYLDLILLCACPLCAALGTLIAGTIKRVNQRPEDSVSSLQPYLMRVVQSGREEAMPEEEKSLVRAEIELEERKFHFARVQSAREPARMAFIGLALGFVIALYFVGAITQSVTSLARVLALCVLLGYQAPSLWVSQERVLSNLIEKKVRSLLGMESSKRGKSTTGE